MQIHAITLIQSDPSAAEQAGFAIGKLVGAITFFILVIAIIVGFIFLIRYIIRKSSRKENLPSPKKEQQSVATSVKIICNKCTIENAAAARFCKSCGFEIAKK